MYKNFEFTWRGELPGTRQQIWDAFTRHKAAYLWPVAYEPRVGGSERGLTSAGGTVTAWDPPRHFRTQASTGDGWFNALDYRLDGTHLTYRHTTVFDEVEYAVQEDACVQHTRFYQHSLGEYLAHFAEREPHYLGLGDVPGSTAEVLARLGVGDATVGDRVELGVIDYRDGTMVGVRSDDALIRFYGRDVWGWPVGVAVHSFDRAADEHAWREKVTA
jgi:hypothetical protein